MQAHSAALNYSTSQSLYLSLSPAKQSTLANNSAAGNNSSTSAAAAPGSDKVNLSAAGQLASAQDQNQSGLDLSPAVSMLKNVLHQALGLDVGLVNIQDLEAQQTDSVSASALSMQSSDGKRSQSAQGFSYEEQHSSELALSGTLVTKDGQQLNFSLDVSMESDFSVQAAQLQDGPAPQPGGDAPAGAQPDSQPLQFNLGNDAGPLSGSSVLGMLTKMLQSFTDGSSNGGSNASAAADGGKSTDGGNGDFGQQVLNLLARFKVWAGQSDKLLADQTLSATAVPAAAAQSASQQGNQADSQQAAPVSRIDTTA
jgi:hypothetical protein